jgi:hypothetical protein
MKKTGSVLNYAKEIKLYQLNSLKVRNLNAKISWKPCLVVFGSYLLI